MALEKDFELLDEYLRNKLNAADKATFEQKLQADADLQREYKLQQKIAEGLRQARTAELKNMLNNIPVSSVHGSEISIGVKTLISITVAGLVATGIYLYLDKEETEVPAQQQIAKTETPAEVPTEHQTEPAPANEAEATTTAPASSSPATETPQPDQPKQQPAVTNQQPATNKESTSVTKPVIAPKQKDSVSKPEIHVFEPGEETESTKAVDDKTATESTPKANKTTLTVKTDANNKKYNFHYQFKNGELYLFGPFDKKLIEIMEFFSDNKHTVFLFHENKYYLLNEANEKVKPLTSITDPTLIKKLKEHRSGN
ncbi:hypothetical protein ACFQ21_04090 [Ohtaekwangia kribbensis]|jgi:hypothetical protein|uniref:Uncharacterized protein n=1 Tax=Ohtaekwangia kribbensis TaxID=688913 RepID=A0ABW3JY00_9BACT